MAPTVACRIDALRATGRLIVAAGRIRRIVPGTHRLHLSVDLRGKSHPTTVEADWVVNCSGPARDYGAADNPLAFDLLQCGAARLDPLALGLDVAADCALIGADGTASDRLFALGPPTRGKFWEITSVPDIRSQCAALARKLEHAVPTTSGPVAA
jgi:uncharacterized NAD(P)/FAD-binding protein YdhS